MADMDIQEQMRDLAEHAVAAARAVFLVELDYSEPSLRQVESMLACFYAYGQYRNAVAGQLQPLVEDTVRHLAEMLGAYLGEVIRRNLGGEWATQTPLPDEPRASIRLLSGWISPIGKVHKRLTEGPDDDILTYYGMVKALATGAEPSTPPANETWQDWEKQFPQGSFHRAAWFALYWPALRAQAQVEAFQFAQECRGDVKRIEAEIRKREESMQNLIAMDPNGPMRPGTSVRNHNDAYLSALHEAIAIVARLANERQIGPDTPSPGLNYG